MSDYYTLLAYIQNANKDILTDLNNVIKTDKEIERGDITEMIITDDVDEFAEGKKKENIVENIKEPQKNKRRINIPDAEIKKFHYRYNENFEEYNEPSNRQPEPEPYTTSNPTQEEYYTDDEERYSTQTTSKTKRRTKKSITTPIKQTTKKIAKKNNRG